MTTRKILGYGEKTIHDGADRWSVFCEIHAVDEYFEAAIYYYAKSPDIHLSSSVRAKGVSIAAALVSAKLEARDQFGVKAHELVQIASAVAYERSRQ